MKGRYLEVTYRDGKPLAAYLYLPRGAGQKSERTEKAAPGILVDFAADGAPIGLELPSPTDVTAGDVNRVLEMLGLKAMAPAELEPLRAA